MWPGDSAPWVCSTGQEKPGLESRARTRTQDITFKSDRLIGLQERATGADVETQSTGHTCGSRLGTGVRAALGSTGK